jgi:hypothetical protein
MTGKNGNGSPSVNIETLTVDDMRKILDNQLNPRPPSAAHINRLADQMRRGKWALNGSAIVIDDRGRLVDGQHRLNAAVLSDMPLTAVIVRNATEGLMEIDTGKRRSFSDLLRGRGFENAVPIAAAVRIMHAIMADMDPFYSAKSWNVTNSDLFTTLAKLKRRTIEWAASHAGSCSKHRVVPAGVATAVFYQAAILDEELAGKFAVGITDGADLADGSPMYVCRRNMLNAPARHDNVGRRVSYGVLVKAWNCVAAGIRRVGLFKMMESEELPKLEKPK